MPLRGNIEPITNGGSGYLSTIDARGCYLVGTGRTFLENRSPEAKNQTAAHR